MITNFNKFANNIIFKIIVLLIIVSFVFWGIADIFRNFKDNSVASVGKYKIDNADISQVVEKDLSELQKAFGTSMTKEQLQLFNLEKSAMYKLINRYLLASFNEDFGITVGVDTVAAKIRSFPQFLDDKGNFSTERFNYVLLHENISEKFLMDAFSKDMPIDFIMNAVVADRNIPDKLIDINYELANEVRDVISLTIPFDYISNIPTPNDDEIAKFYADNKHNYKSNEMRNFSFIAFSEKDILDKIDISKEKLQNLYDSNIEIFTEVEKRDIYNFVVDTKDLAEKIYLDLQNNDVVNTKEKFLADIKLDTDLFIKDLTKESLPNEIADTVFALSKNEISQPILSPMGWHVIKVVEIKQKNIKSFVEAEPQLRQMLKKQEGDELLFSYVNNIEDLIAGGISLEEIAKKYNFNLAKSGFIDQNKLNQKSEIVTTIPPIDNLMDLVFSIEKNITSQLLYSDKFDIYTFIRVDEIIPESFMELNKVKDRVIEEWKIKKREDFNRDLVINTSNKIKNIDDIKLQASENLFILKESKIKRNDFNQNIFNINAINEIYNLEKGQILPYYKLSNGNYVIAAVADISKPNINYESDDYKKFKSNFILQYQSDINDLFFKSLHDIYPVKVNDKIK